MKRLVMVGAAVSMALAVLAGSAEGRGTSAEPTQSSVPAPTSASAAPRTVSPGSSVTATPSTAAPGPTPTPTHQPRTVTINVSGDLLWHNTLWFTAQADAQKTGASGYDFAPQLAGLTDYVSKSDIAVCHEEVPFGQPSGPFKSYPQFVVPPQTAAAIKATGFDICTTASNHSVDDGFDGIARTLDALDAQGVRHVGTYRTQAEALQDTILTTASGVEVAFVSGTFGLNGLPLPEGKPWAVQLLQTDELLARAKRARDAGADIVAVHVHAGDEYQTQPNAQQVGLARALTASPYVDFVFGQHVHVVQPVDVVNGKWVVYGTGNLIADNAVGNPRTFDGAIVEVTFTERGDGTFAATSAEFAPTFITSHHDGPVRVHQISKALAAGLGNAAQLQASAERTRATILSKGTVLAEK